MNAPASHRKEPSEARARPLSPQYSSSYWRLRPTPRQLEILGWIRRFIAKRHYPPTFREIGTGVGIRSTNGVNDVLNVLERKGYLRIDRLQQRSIVLTDLDLEDETADPVADLRDAIAALNATDPASLPAEARAELREVLVAGRVRIDGDSLGDRMKGYERAARSVLPRRLPVILRVDGKGFHGVTRGCDRPFDDHLMGLMNMTAIRLCSEAQGAVFGFVQSDEISILLHNYKRLQTDPWFDNEVQKLVSVSAGIASGWFSREWTAPVAFDARVFVLPEAEVCNYFIWRQQDATRNSIQMAVRAVYSHAQVDEKNTSEMQEMLHAKGVNWNDYPVGCKRGRALVRQAYERDGVTRHAWVVEPPPIFTADRSYVERHLAVEPEPSSVGGSSG